MGIINQIAKENQGLRKHAKTVEAKAHKNWMGGESYDIGDPIFNLRLAASTCFFGEPMYYQQDEADHRPSRSRGRTRLSEQSLKYLRETLQAIDPQDWRGMSPRQMMETAIDAALDHNPEATLQEAVRLRQEENIRTTPQVILVRAACHPKIKGTGLVRRYAPEILRRADEPSVQLAYYLHTHEERKIPNALKKAWRDYLQGCNEYQLAKYRMESREVKTVDVVNLCHPKSPAIHKLVNGELRVTEETWEGILSDKGASKDSWMEAIDKMGHMALLRNIRNFLDKNVEPASFVEKLILTAENGKQLPFRYISAYQSNPSAPPQVKDAIETCLHLSLKNLPHFPGRTMSLCDNSGSARNTTTSSMGTIRMSDIGNITGVLTGKATDEGYLGVFGDKLESFGIRKGSSVFDDLATADSLGRGIGGGTENGIWLFWKQAIEQKEHWDNVFVYSDMQAGHGGLYGTNQKAYKDYLWMGSSHIDVAKLILTYRQKVNPNVNVFLVQIAGYQDTIVPEFYDRTFILGGWGDGLLRFAASMIEPKQ